MKLPSLKKSVTDSYPVTINVQAANRQDAEQMKEAIESFATHFSLAEMKSAATKLKNATNRKMIKTFL